MSKSYSGPTQPLQPIFPSTKVTGWALDTEDIYGGAHRYQFLKSTGFNNGEATYVDENDPDAFAEIQFVHKADDGTITPGLHSEHLVIALLDRIKKLDARFPSEHNQKMIIGLQMFLDASEARVKERVKRGVMGNLQK